MLSEAFNLGKVDPAFAEKLMQMLGIKTMSTSEFWAECANQDIDCKPAGSSVTVEQFPFYASCNVGKNRMELFFACAPFVN